jgi:tRNA(fMet)-specific endonuclease VapC
LLDTNIIIALFGQDPQVLEQLPQVQEVYVPSIALGELYYGAQKSECVSVNVTRIEEFAANSTVLGCDHGTARRYGGIKNFLRQKGRPLPENDLWIAAIAMQHTLVLVTRDEHFRDIAGLTIEAW